MYTIITVVIIAVFSLLILGIVLKIFSLAKRDIHFTELSPNTGKMIKMGANITNILFNSQKEHYELDGELNTSRGQDLGAFFNLTGRIPFGISPIWEVFKFSTSWNEYAEGKITEGGKPKPPSIIEKRENGTTFERYYTHAVMIHGAEMAKEGGDENDMSTTKIDAVMLATIEITNIIKAVYKIPPEGIAFAQTDTSIEASFNDYVKGEKWEDFRNKNKGNQDSGFVKYILEEANPILEKLDIGMKVKAIELKYYDLTPSPENEALAKSQTLLAVAKNEGDAEITRAEKHKRARKLEGEAEKEALKEVAEVIGQENIATYANLGLVAKTHLVTYGGDKVTPIVNVSGDKP